MDIKVLITVTSNHLTEGTGRDMVIDKPDMVKPDMDKPDSETV